MRKAGFGYSRLHPPTVDEVIDRIRIRYSIIIYNSFAPFVDEMPTGKKRIVYGYSVKKCDTKSGWNFRIKIGRTQNVDNIYKAKREALTIALEYIIKHILTGKGHQPFTFYAQNSPDSRKPQGLPVYNDEGKNSEMNDQMLLKLVKTVRPTSQSYRSMRRGCMPKELCCFSREAQKQHPQS